MKIAYFDCFSGISGDMILGSLIDAGADFSEIEKDLSKLNLKNYNLYIKQVQKNGITGTKFDVDISDDKHSRNFKDIKDLIEKSSLEVDVKNISIKIFQTLAEVEAKIHGKEIEDVHFHEVGAVDSIIDIVGTLFGIEFLGITSISSSSLPLGSGFTKTGHGTIPIPAPATIALLKGVPVYDSGLKHELVTPTGAALVKELAGAFGSMPSMIVDSVGYGVGSRDLPDRPNLIRIILGEEQSEKQVETVVILEANLDDTSPEWSGFLMDRLFEAGALDVIFSPIQMKSLKLPSLQLKMSLKVYLTDEH